MGECYSHGSKTEKKHFFSATGTILTKFGTNKRPHPYQMADNSKILKTPISTNFAESIYG